MRQKTKIITGIFSAIILIFSNTANSQYLMERLNRGIIAVKTDNGYYISWRMFGNDPKDIGFNLYRGSQKLNSEPITNSTDFIDKGAPLNSSYTVKPVINGREVSSSKKARILSSNYLRVPIKQPSGNYTAGDASVGDLDGDSEYEIVLKWEDNPKDNSHKGKTNRVILDAYKLNGTHMWRIDLGINIREGAHYTQFMVYDLDGDGRAEVACKTADGTVDGAGKVIGDAKKDYRNSNGYVLKGPEFLTVFDGETGKALSTVKYIPSRHPSTENPTPKQIKDIWGDNYGNRVDRFLACIAYLDGKIPSLVMCRGYYTRTFLAAWNFRNGKLENLWTFDSDASSGNRKYRGQGNHSVSVGDVDGDGKHEIIYGACAIDHDGKGLYSTGLGHGDASHLSDMDPDRPGLEFFMPHESKKAGVSFRDAGTGKIIWSKNNSGDVGRGCAADISASTKGFECWGTRGMGLYTCKGGSAGKLPSSVNHVIWWDGDLLRELLNSNRIDKYNGPNLLKADGCSSINGTKSNPCLQVDLFGDWREEVIFRTNDNKALHIYTTTIPTNHRIYTLMHDPQYRVSIAWQNVAYNQPPHTGFYLGDGMKTLPQPNITVPGVSTKKSPIRLRENSFKKVTSFTKIIKSQSSAIMPDLLTGGKLIFCYDLSGRLVSKKYIKKDIVNFRNELNMADGIYLIEIK